MNSVRAGTWLLLTAMLSAPLASAAPKTKAGSAALSHASSPSERSRVAVSEALRRHLADAGLTDSFPGYAISPYVTQLRRYVESKRVMLVCVVDLSLRDEDGNLLASVRGSSTSSGASAYDAIDSATHAAVARLPQALQALRANSPSAPMADARRQWEAPLK